MNPCHYPKVTNTRSRSRSPSPRPTPMASNLHVISKGRSVSSPMIPSENCQATSQQPHGDNVGAQGENLFVDFRHGYSSIGDEGGFQNNVVPSTPKPKPQSNNPSPVPFLNIQSGSFNELDHVASDKHFESTESTPLLNNESSNASSSEQKSKKKLDRQKSYYTPSMVDELRKRNQLYFLDPITKLRYFHGFPWKMCLQSIKMIIITIQIVMFGAQRENIVEFFQRSTVAYKHLLLKHWDSSHETMPYPPATGRYALYSLEELYGHMDFAMENYYRLPEDAMAPLELEHEIDSKTTTEPIELCFTANAFKTYPNKTIVVLSKVRKNCTHIRPIQEGGNYTYDVKRYLEESHFDLPQRSFLQIFLRFPVKTFHLNLLETYYGPTCYRITVTIEFSNIQRSGQILTSLRTDPVEVPCCDKKLSPAANVEMKAVKTKAIVFDSVVMAVCCLSTILCSRSLMRSNKLRKATAKFFQLQRGKSFCISTHMEYINMWYIIIICNDILTVAGSCFKIQLESRVFSISSQNYEICSILLGIGIFLTYVGILRYLGFFKSYNVLILTLKTSFPHVLRFLVCAVCLYTGFLFCGWIVFSPYHIKFLKLSTASECLFSLVNGDDMFVTFSALTTTSNAVWYFHRVYLYVFISLFIYVVLSVFIAVIMDNYENLKHYYEKGFIETEVQNFIREDGELSERELFSHVAQGHRWNNCLFCFFPCFANRNNGYGKGAATRDTSSLLATL